MMLALLVYSYATGRFSSREIKRREIRKTKLLEARKVIEERYADLERKTLPVAPAVTATAKEKMEYRLKTPEGHGQYKKRKETIEPAFGIIKSRLGFRQFLMRGIENVGIEWNLVTLAYNVKRLYRMESVKMAGTFAAMQI